MLFHDVKPQRRGRAIGFAILVWCASSVNLVRALDPAAENDATWKAGVARAAITPDQPVWLAGYGTKRPPDGKLHDLWMKALALEDPHGHRVVLITSDFQGVPKSMSDIVFGQLLQRFQLARHQVMFTFSHNHCGPRLGDDLVDYYPVESDQVQLVATYTIAMQEKLVAMVGESLDRLEPATVHSGNGHTDFAVNRRNNVEAEVSTQRAQGIPLKGPVDHNVPVLLVKGLDGKAIAIVFGYACHPTTLNFNTWCGDYPGFAQLEIEQHLPNVTAMFVNTCGGDQNPLPRRTVELCQRYGHMLAVAVRQAVEERPLRPITPRLHSSFEMIKLPYLEVMTRDTLHTALQDTNEIRGRWAARMLQKLDEGETFAGSYPYPIHAWRLGEDLLMLGMGAETVVDYALRFKREFGESTWVCGYTDDMIAYIPSRRVWEEGGYEGGSNLYEYGRPALRWAGDIEDRIAAAMHHAVQQVRNQPIEANEPADSLRHGLVAHWTFDEADGTEIKDVVNAANGGTLEGEATRVDGPLHGAVGFDGKQSRVWVDSPPTLDLPAEMSAFAWIRCANVAAGEYGQCIYGQTGPGGNGGQYELCVGRGKNLHEVTVLWHDVDVCVSNAKLKAGQWYHIGFTRTGKPGNWNCTIYVDGTAIGAAKNIATDVGPALPFAIGRPGAYDGLYFHGAMDDLRIYDRALSPNEVKVLFQVR